MTRKTLMLRTLTLYFMEKGKILDNREYKRQDDIPYRASIVTRVFGSWGRLPRMIKKNFPEEYEIIMKGEPTTTIVEEPVVNKEPKPEALDLPKRRTSSKVPTRNTGGNSGKEE